MNTHSRHLRPAPLSWILFFWVCGGIFAANAGAEPVTSLCQVEARDIDRLYIPIYGMDLATAQRLRQDLQQRLEACKPASPLAKALRSHWAVGGYIFKSVDGIPAETLYLKEGNRDRQKALQDLIIQDLTDEVGKLSNESKLKSLVGKSKQVLVLSVNFSTDVFAMSQRPFVEYVFQRLTLHIQRKRKPKPPSPPALELELAAERTYLSSTIEKLPRVPEAPLLLGLEQVLLAVFAPSRPAPRPLPPSSPPPHNAPVTSIAPPPPPPAIRENCPRVPGADCQAVQTLLSEAQTANQTLKTENTRLNNELAALKATPKIQVSQSTLPLLRASVGVAWALTIAGAATTMALIGLNEDWSTSPTGTRQLPMLCGESGNMSCGSISHQYSQGVYVALGFTVSLALGAIAPTIAYDNITRRENSKK